MKKVAQPLRLSTLVASLILFPSVAAAELPDEINAEVGKYLSNLSKSSDLDVRKATTLTKGYVNEKDEAITALKLGLKDPKLELRFLSAVSLYNQGEEDALQTMVESLKASQANEKFYDEVVSVLPNELELKLLESYLKEVKEATPFAAYGYLARQNGELFQLFEKELLDPKTSKKALNVALKKIEAKFVDSAKKMLASKDSEVAQSGLALLLRLHTYPSLQDKTLPLLISAASSQDLSVATQATMALLEEKEPKARKAAIELLKKVTEAPQRADLLVKMANAGIFLSKKEVEPWLKDEDKTLKEAAYIVSAPDSEVGAEILKMMKSTDFADRMIGLRAAGYTGLDDAADYLKKSVFEARVDVRRASSESLAQLAKPSTVDALKQAVMRETDLATKLNAVKALGEIGDQEAVTVLTFNSRDKNVEVRKAIVDALAQSKAAQATAQLDSLVSDRNRDIRWAAFLGLLKKDPKRASKFFDAMFRNPEPGFLTDFDALPASTRKLVYSYLLSSNQGAGRDALLTRLMITGAYRQSLEMLAANESLLPRVRQQVLVYLADHGSKRDWLLLENASRTTKNDSLKRLATWLLLRNEALQEATLRGFILSDDQVKQAIGTAGLAMSNKVEGKKKGKKRRSPRKKKK